MPINQPTTSQEDKNIHALESPTNPTSIQDKKES